MEMSFIGVMNLFYGFLISNLIGVRVLNDLLISNEFFLNVILSGVSFFRLTVLMII